MNVFENLVTELQNENLLENTVMEERPRTGGILDEEFETVNRNLELNPSSDFDHENPQPADSKTTSNKTDGNGAVESNDVKTSSDGSGFDSKLRKTSEENFRKRAVSEVSSLQMVEHILTGVEREYMRLVPNVFDDLNAKKALHVFMDIAAVASSAEIKNAEVALMRETEAWCMALAERDKKVAVSNLRRFCENSHPALSSQALLALARFYRNSPYSEGVRAKFDFVMTRLFSRPIDHGKRACLFNREEMTGHINMLYGDWSSISLYTTDDDESNLLLTRLSLDEMAAEAEEATSFDSLLASEFFSRLRLFKESISELFYAPGVTAAAVEGNIRIGNAYVTLLARERRMSDVVSIQSKYGGADGQSVSEATGRTLDLAQLLSVGKAAEPEEKKAVDTQKEESTNAVPVLHPEANDRKSASQGTRSLIGSAQRANKSLAATVIILVVVSVGIYVWANYFAAENVSTAGVRAASLDNSVLADQMIMTARISNEMFYGVLSPSWDALSKKKRMEFLRKVFDAGKEKGYGTVTLIDKDGRQAAYASATRMDVVMR